jgi:WD40 repeat protein
MVPQTRFRLVVAAFLAVLIAAPSALAQELEAVKEQKWKHEDAEVAGLRRVMFTADGKTLVTSGYECIRLWDVTGDEPKQRSAITRIANLGRHGLWDVAISPDGTRVAAGGDRILYLYDAGEKELKERAVQKDQSGAVRALAFSPDGKLLVSGSDDKTIYVYDLSGDKPRERGVFKPEKAGSAMISLEFFADGKKLMFAYQGGKGNVGLADVSGKAPMVLGGAVTENTVRRATVSADGKLLALFTGNFDIQVYDLDGTTLKKRATLKGHTKQGQGLGFSPDGKLLASAGKDGKYMIWDVASGKQLLSKLIGGDIDDLAFAPGKAAAGEYRLALTSRQHEARLLTLKLK